MTTDAKIREQSNASVALKFVGLWTPVSLVLTSLLVVMGAQKFGDLSGWYTDHLHHCYATWVFFQKGLSVYTLPFAEASAGVVYPHPFIGEWGANPGFTYPPGVILAFAPAALLGAFVPMSLKTFGTINVLFLLLWAHVAFAVFRHSLSVQPRGARLIASVVVYMILMRAALNGFYDIVWLGFGAAAQLYALRERTRAALWMVTLAGLFHFRAIVLAPLGVLMLRRVWEKRESNRLFLRSLVGPALISCLSLATFALMYPATAAMRAAHPSVWKLAGSPGFVGCVALGIGAAFFAFRYAGTLGAATSSLVSLVAISELSLYFGFWWHSSVALALVFLPGVATFRSASGLRQLGVLQLLMFEGLVWADRQGGAFGLLRQISSDYKW